MKLIRQNFNIVNQKGFSIKDIKKHIEYCARISYKSQDRITDNSYEKFVNMLENRDHARPLEFGTVHLKMSITYFHTLRDTLCINRVWNDQWIKYKYVGDIVYITSNYRYYLTIKEVYPDIEKFLTEEDNEYYPKRYTVHFILSRGIMDEFRTHIGLSHLAESSRYCNYSKDRFDNEITFIKPSWANIEEKQYTRDIYESEEYYKNFSPEYSFIIQLLTAEATYLKLLENNLKPQQARDVLPLGVKSELISCGFKEQWDNFFYRRCAQDAHPMAREIAIPLKEDFDKLPY